LCISLFGRRIKKLGDPAVRGEKIEQHAVTDLVVRNNENKPSLTSGAAPVADEHQKQCSL